MDITLDKIILSYMLNEKQFALQLTNSVSSEYLKPSVRWLYEIADKHFNNPKFKELPTDKIINEYLCKECSDKELVEKSLKILNEVRETSAEPAEFTWYVNKLKYRYNEQIQRVAINRLAKTLNNQSLDNIKRTDDANSIFKESVVKIDSIHRKEAYSEGSLSTSAKDRYERYKEVKSNPEIAQGVLTGFDDLDRITNGFRSGEFILIGGATGTGKSILMQNISVNSYLGKINDLDDFEYNGGKNILYFSLEMPKEEIEMRIDASIAEIDFLCIRDGKLSSEEEQKYAKSLRFQSKYPKEFHIVDMSRGVTAREIELKFIEMCDTWGFPPDLIVIDYMGIMSPTVVQNSDWLSLGNISQELHEFARAYKVPVLSAVQLNRPKDAGKTEYSTNRVARSNMIPDNANIILQIECRGEDENDRMDMPIHIVKIRNGPKGQFVLMKDFSKMKVSNLDDSLFAEDDDDEI